MPRYINAINHGSHTGYKITFHKGRMTTSVRYWPDTNKDIFLSVVGTLKYYGWTLLSIQPITISSEDGAHDSKM